MKFFPEFLVPDPDKKFHLNDKDLISKLIEDVLKKDKEVRLIRQTQRNIDHAGYGEAIDCVLIKNEKEIRISFRKISYYNKDYFDQDLSLYNSHWDCVNNNQKSGKPMTNENLGTKKLCGINIDSPTLNFSTSFAVGSNDVVYNDPPKDNKLYKCAYENLGAFGDYICKKL